MPWTTQKSCKNFKQFQSSRNYLGFICEAVHLPYNNRCHRVWQTTFLCKKLCSIFSTEYFAKLSSRIILRVVSYAKGLFSFISCLCKKWKVSLRRISFIASHSRIPEVEEVEILFQWSSLNIFNILFWKDNIRTFWFK